MNTGRSAAEERLLDAALEQMFAGGVAGQWTSVRGTRSRTWRAAALVLFGLSVTGAVLWQARAVAPRDPFTAQEPAVPAPLPPQVRAEGRSGIGALPEDTANLCAFLLTPGDVQVVDRLRALRRLQVAALDQSLAGIRLRRKHASWAAAPADFLAPLAALPELEELCLPGDLVLRPEHLAALRGCPQLRTLQFVREHVRVDDGFVEALAALPHLRSLNFDIVRLDADAVARLQRLPLQEIEIARCPGFDAAAFAELCAMKSLHTVVFRDLGRRDFLTGDGDGALWGPGADDLRRLGGLPALRSLTLHCCAFAGEALAALPDGLTSLRLWGTDLEPEDFRELIRFGRLRCLEVGTWRYNLAIGFREPAGVLAAKADAFAAALGGLRLESLRFTGALTGSLLEQIAQQPDLADLCLLTDRLPSLEALAGAPKLRELELVENTGPSGLLLDDLRPLARCRSLRRLDLHTLDAAVDAGELAKVLGPDVAVTVDTFAGADKR